MGGFLFSEFWSGRVSPADAVGSCVARLPGGQGVRGCSGVGSQCADPTVQGIRFFGTACFVLHAGWWEGAEVSPGFVGGPARAVLLTHALAGVVKGRGRRLARWRSSGMKAGTRICAISHPAIRTASQAVTRKGPLLSEPLTQSGPTEGLTSHGKQCVAAGQAAVGCHTSNAGGSRVGNETAGIPMRLVAVAGPIARKVELRYLSFETLQPAS